MRSLKLSAKNIIDSPLIWILAGLIVGIILGVNSASVWILSIGLVGFVVYLHLHGHAKQENEGKLFLSGPAFILSWMVGFTLHSLLF